jgi:hypothetical protein
MFPECSLNVHQVDRLFEWKTLGEAPIQASLEAQPKHVSREFKQRLDACILSFNEQVMSSPKHHKY